MKNFTLFFAALLISSIGFAQETEATQEKPQAIITSVNSGN